MNLTTDQNFALGPAHRGSERNKIPSLARRHYHLKQAHSLLAVQKGISSTRELLVGEAERGHGRDRTARNARGKRPTRRAYDISSVFRANGVMRSSAIMGLFSFSEAAVVCLILFLLLLLLPSATPFDSEGKADSNT
jgi:hypothetical protein